MKRKLKRWWSIFHSDHLRERKLKIAAWVDKKYPGKYCWADCVIWAYSPYKFNPFKIDKSDACKKESIEHSCKLCYCGGWNNGVCFALLPQEERDRLTAEYHAESKLETEITF